jgi:hypothetical protein
MQELGLPKSGNFKKRIIDIKNTVKCWTSGLKSREPNLKSRWIPEKVASASAPGVVCHLTRQSWRMIGVTVAASMSSKNVHGIAAVPVAMPLFMIVLTAIILPVLNAQKSAKSVER